MNIKNDKNIIQQCVTEFFGIGFIIFISIGILSATQLKIYFLNPWEVSCICGFSVSLSIYWSYTVSGAHLNPALTIFLWLSSQFHQEKVLPYIISQIAGAFFLQYLFIFLITTH